MKNLSTAILILIGLGAVALATVPSVTTNMAAVVPTLNTDDCAHATIAASTSTVVSTALSTRKAYDFTSVGGGCWCVFHASDAATATTGRYFRDGAVIVGRPDDARMACYCDNATEFAACQDDAE